MSDGKGDEAKVDDAPKPKPRGRGRRRVSICAVPVKLEAGWKPRVVDKSDDAKKR